MTQRTQARRSRFDKFAGRSRGCVRTAGGGFSAGITGTYQPILATRPNQVFVIDKIDLSVAGSASATVWNAVTLTMDGGTTELPFVAPSAVGLITAQHMTWNVRGAMIVPAGSSLQVKAVSYDNTGAATTLSFVSTMNITGEWMDVMEANARGFQNNNFAVGYLPSTGSGSRNDIVPAVAGMSNVIDGMFVSGIGSGGGATESILLEFSNGVDTFDTIAKFHSAQSNLTYKIAAGTGMCRIAGPLGAKITANPTTNAAKRRLGVILVGHREAAHNTLNPHGVPINVTDGGTVDANAGKYFWFNKAGTVSAAGVVESVCYQTVADPYAATSINSTLATHTNEFLVVEGCIYSHIGGGAGDQFAPTQGGTLANSVIEPMALISGQDLTVIYDELGCPVNSQNPFGLNITRSFSSASATSFNVTVWGRRESGKYRSDIGANQKPPYQP